MKHARLLACQTNNITMITRQPVTMTFQNYSKLFLFHFCHLSHHIWVGSLSPPLILLLFVRSCDQQTGYYHLQSDRLLFGWNSAKYTMLLTMDRFLDIPKLQEMFALKIAHFRSRREFFFQRVKQIGRQDVVK